MPERLRPLCRWALLALIPFLGGVSGGTALADGSAGQAITNQAAASHHGAAGDSESTLSNFVSLDITAVSGLSVAPDDAVATGFVLSGEEVVRRFTVTNLANRDDRFQVVFAAITPPAALTGLFFDLDGNGSIDPGDTPVTPGTTSSPLLPPGGSLGVLARYSASGAGERADGRPARLLRAAR